MEARQLGVTVVAVAALGTAIGAGAATADDPSWQKALEARSIALNREYGLGDHAQRRALDNPSPGWLEALRTRSAALNQAYGLGGYVRQGARSAATPDWLAALQARSAALNRQYGLGEHGRAAARGGRSSVVRGQRARDAAVIARTLTPGPYATTGKTFDPAGVPVTGATRKQSGREAS